DAMLARGRHSVEVRLYAEDAEAGFLPATGRVELLKWPAPDADVRIDTGIEPGTEIGDRFDPMLAKIIIGGDDRAAAFARLTQALDDTTILGLTTNLRFLRWLVRQPVVLDGAARIDTLERIWPPDGGTELSEPPPEAWAAAARLLGPGGWRLNARPRLRLESDSGLVRTVEVGDSDTNGLPDA